MRSVTEEENRGEGRSPGGTLGNMGDGGASQSRMGSSALTAEETRKVARLARLALSDEQIETYRGQLGAILTYVERLRAEKLDGVEPMAHAGDVMNRMDEDVPREPMDAAALMKMAPEKEPPFIRVPKVIGESGGA